MPEVVIQQIFHVTVATKR